MILLIYPKYVGGKFISNCLALSRHCVVQNATIAKMDLNCKHPEKYYQFKLASVLKTLPEKSNLSKWADYEFGCTELYGIDEDFYKDSSITNIKDTIKSIEIFNTLQQHNKQSCLIAHDFRTLLKYLLIFPGARVVDFYNYREFRQLAASLKCGDVNEQGYKLAETYHINDRQFYQLDSFNIDVDDTFFSWHKFNTMMERLYRYLDFDDYQPELVKQFWEQYINLHK